MKKGGFELIQEMKDNKIVSILIVSVVAIVAIVICFLAVLGYNSSVTYSTADKKIEVQATNSNSVR